VRSRALWEPDSLDQVSQPADDTSGKPITGDAFLQRSPRLTSPAHAQTCLLIWYGGGNLSDRHAPPPTLTKEMPHQCKQPCGGLRRKDGAQRPSLSGDDALRVVAHENVHRQLSITVV
jgi:hypothetical protein